MRRAGDVPKGRTQRHGAVTLGLLAVLVGGIATACSDEGVEPLGATVPPQDLSAEEWSSAVCRASTDFFRSQRELLPASDSGADRYSMFSDWIELVDGYAIDLQELPAGAADEVQPSFDDLLAAASEAPEGMAEVLSDYEPTDFDGTLGEDAQVEAGRRMEGPVWPLLRSLGSLADAMHLGGFEIMVTGVPPSSIAFPPAVNAPGCQEFAEMAMRLPRR